MLRSILLKLLALGIIPLTLADATATSNTTVILDRQSTTKPEAKFESKADLVLGCTTTQNSADCSATANPGKFQIRDELWLNNIANVMLSGSMFQECRNRIDRPSHINSQALKRSPVELTTSRCLLGWQLPRQSKADLPEVALLPDSNGNSLGVAESTPAIASPSRPQFPKLSRSSLIVSLPAEDSTFTPLNTKLANPAPETKRIASPFGWRTRPYSYQLQFHQGIDYGAPFDSPVVAVGNGIVTKVVSGCYDFGNLFCGGQLGNWIEIDHGDGRLGIYGHLKNNSITVKEGMKVWRNQEIARVGSSGWSTGAHLDFRFKVNGEYEDPAKYVMAIED